MVTLHKVKMLDILVIRMIYHQLYVISPLYNIYKCINDYETDFIATPDISHFIRELCICRDSGDFSVLTSTETSQLLEYICTI